ncbi:hypothetical protein M0802_004437 [Mischocyttarus mexicanus]|nr:hypothetical protein M0802_004437 [Mischocyttarus mexicanus]
MALGVVATPVAGAQGGVSEFSEVGDSKRSSAHTRGSCWEEENEEEEKEMVERGRRSGRTKAAGGSGPGGASIDLLAHLRPRLLGP